MPSLDLHTRHNLSWAVLKRLSDGAEAEVLLMPGEFRHFGTIDLSAIPAERVLRRPA